jgi:hypothetical protein
MKSLASTSKIISMPESVYYELLDKAFPDTYPVIEKELNLDEKRFLDELNNLISQDVDAAIEYLNSKEFKQALFDYRDLKEDFFKDVEDQCYDIANSKAQSVEEFMGNFYEAGAKQGLSQIMRKLNYTPADEQAFFFVNQYAFTKVKNLGSDLVGGMREHIWRGIAEGQSQDKIAHSIENLPLKPLPDKRLSVHQRAIQIAHTESSRAVNIGKLQSWADYGINLVKINEIGDGLECKICLNLISQNPYNIKDADGLIPAHPNCRHTWVPVTLSENENARDFKDLPDKPVSNPPVMTGGTVNNPKSQIVGGGKINPLTEEQSLRSKLSGVVDEKDIPTVAKNMSDFHNATKDLHYENLSIWDSKYKNVTNMYTDHKKGTVSVPDEVDDYVKNGGLAMSIHNHPKGSSCLPSVADISNGMGHNRTIYGVTSSSDNGYIVMVNHAPEDNAGMFHWVELDHQAKLINNKIKRDFEKSKMAQDYDAKLRGLLADGKISPKSANNAYNTVFHKYLIENTDKYCKLMNKKLSKCNINVYHVTP